MTGKGWHLWAVFENKDQAQQAAKMILSMMPSQFDFEYTNDAGIKEWHELGFVYQASDRRVP